MPRNAAVVLTSTTVIAHEKKIALPLAVAYLSESSAFNVPRRTVPCRAVPCRVCVRAYVRAYHAVPCRPEPIR